MKVKVVFNDDCRRVNLEPCTYSRLCDFVRDLFQVHNFNVKYEDDEGERISLSSDGELTEAFEVSRGLNVMLKLHVMVLADKPSPSAESLVQNSAAPSPSSTSSSIAASAQPPFEVSEASAQKETAGSFNDPPVLEDWDEEIEDQEAKECEAAVSSDCDSAAQVEENLEAVAYSELVHHSVVCDGCQQSPLRGLRYKCITCPDFDLCHSCHVTHPHAFDHFFAVMKKAADIPEQQQKPIAQQDIVHLGVACKKCHMSPIRGARFKCSVCDNYDLCASCEVIGDLHDASHPLLKLKQPESRWARCGRSDRSDRGGRSHLHSHTPRTNSNGSGGSGFHHAYGAYPGGGGCALPGFATPFFGSGQSHAFYPHTMPMPPYMMNASPDQMHVNVQMPSQHANGRVDMKIQKAAEKIQQKTQKFAERAEREAQKLARMQSHLESQTRKAASKSQNGPSKSEASTPRSASAASLSTASASAAVSTSGSASVAAPTGSIPTRVVVQDVTLPDQSVVGPDQVLTKVWSIENVSPFPWPAGVHIVPVGGASLYFPQPKQVLAAQPNERVMAEISVRTPTAPGRYTQYFRLATDEGVRFGHPLWIDLTVQNLLAEPVLGVEKSSASPVSVDVPTSSSSVAAPTVVFPKKKKKQAPSPVSVPDVAVVSVAPAAASASPIVATESLVAFSPYPSLVQSLVSMGFAEDRAIFAAVQTNGDLASACELLLSE